MTVIKKNGNREPFDITKIKEQIHLACKGLDINPLRLESTFNANMSSGIKTTEIQELLVLSSIKLITQEEPEWTIVAGRLSMRNLHSEVYKNTKIEYTELEKYLHYAINNGYYRKDILHDYTSDEITELSKLINKSEDFNKTIAQVLMLKSKYLNKNKRGIIEYPQISDLVSAMILGSVETDKIHYTSEFFEMIQKDIISLATPFKANLRLEGGNTGSCFILPVGDSLHQISKSWQDVATISGAGGGIGIYLGYLRPGNTYTPNVVKANNVTRWTKIINDIAVAVNQRGIRPGAVTPALDWWGLDIESFIKMKTETSGDLREKSFDLFPQVVIDSYFVDAVINNRDVYLFNHYTLKEKFGLDAPGSIDNELYKIHEEVARLVEEGKFKDVHKVNAKELWIEFLRVWFEIGDFYITHKDNLNASNYLKATGQIANSANLCVESFSLTKQPANWTTSGSPDGLITKESDGMYHSCSLISINLGNILNDSELLKRACTNAVRILDASIDKGTMPVFEAEKSSKYLRNIGIGTVGTADWMAYNHLSYEKEADLKRLEALYEEIAWYCYEASIDLAVEKGSYDGFEDASYDKMFGKDVALLNEISPNGFDWVQMSENIKKKGIRNFLLLATAPNTSSGIVQNATASYLPPHDKFNVQTLNNLTVPIVPKFIKNCSWYYKSKFNYKPETIVKVTQALQRWIDTGISMEMPVNTNLTNIRVLSDEFLRGFVSGELKAIYYSITVDGNRLACTDCSN